MSPRRQLAFLWGFVAAALVALSPLADRLAAGLPACPLKATTGWPCPGCGTTRAALALADLDVLAAFAVSPLAATGWVALVGGGLVAGGLAVAGIEPPAPPAWTPRRLTLFRLGAAAAIAGNWLYLVAAGV
ncbi:MAG TPA: DUF2752 domain-containing protein [Thermoanaerobaculia bacterium]|nr:DUF2752 domain-containing protein [Thermoanaerobaculia bacterium]